MSKTVTKTNLKETTLKRIMSIENLLVTLSDENLKEIKYQNSILVALGSVTCAMSLLGGVTPEHWAFPTSIHVLISVCDQSKPLAPVTSFLTSCLLVKQWFSGNRYSHHFY